MTTSRKPASPGRKLPSPVAATFARFGSFRRRKQKRTLRIELLGNNGLSLQTVFPHNVKARELLDAWVHYLESLDDSVAVDIERIELYSHSGPVQSHLEVHRLLFTEDAGTRPDEIDISLRVVRVRKAQHRPNSWRRSMLLGVGDPRVAEIVHINAVNEWGSALCCLDVPRYIKIRDLKFVIEKKTSYMAPAQILQFIISGPVDDNKCLDDYVAPGKTYAGLYVALDIQKQLSLPGGRENLMAVYSNCVNHL